MEIRNSLVPIKNKDDKLVKVESLTAIVQKPRVKFLSPEVTGEDRKALQKHERTGRPLGNTEFIERPEKKLGRALKPGKPGPKPKEKCAFAIDKYGCPLNLKTDDEVPQAKDMLPDTARIIREVLEF